MSYTRNVIDVNGGSWTFTLPDQVTIRQGARTDNFRLDGVSEPLIFDYNLTPDLLFGSAYHGIITVDMHENDPADPTNTPPTQESANGLRGTIGINFHNNLGVTIRNPPSYDTMAFYLAGVSDTFPNTPNAFHTVYTHFHPSATGGPLIDSGEFPNFAVRTTVGPFPGAQPGNSSTSPNWIFLDGTIAPGNYSWGNFSFHRRDLSGSDDTSLNLIFFDGAFDPNDLSNLRRQWLASRSLGEAEVGSSHTISAKIDTPDEKDLYSVRLLAGQTYTFDLKASIFVDPVLRLLDLNGQQIAINDNYSIPGNSALNSRIVYTAAATGNYYLEASQKALTTGNYSLEVASRQSSPDSDGSAIFDTAYYLATNLDVAAAGIAAIDHYNIAGWYEGRDPNAYFSTSGYVAANADVRNAGVNPLLHYEGYGWREGRDPSANFDNELYLLNNPDVKAAGLNPLFHYLAAGQSEGRQSYEAIGRATDIGDTSHQGSFDPEYYLLANPDIAAAALITGDANAFAYNHFHTQGWLEGRDPNAYFDTRGYLSAYGDVAAAGIDPLLHYDTQGWIEGRDPSAGFDTQGYLTAYGDVAAARIDPLRHFLVAGVYEGRQSQADGAFG